MNSFAENTVLVVGGDGFIGRHLVSKLIGLKAKVISLGISERANSLADKYVSVDIRNKNNLASALEDYKFNYVFNLCGYIDHSTYGDHGRDVFDVHFVGLMNLLDQVKGPSLKCFLQVGSSDEYGGAQSPQIETIREAAISPYSAAKVACTHLIQSLFKSESFPGVVVRPFLVYGPGQGMSRFVPQVISGCMNDVAFPVTEGKQLRDFCYVEDVVEGMLIAAVTPKALGEVINVASGVPISIRNVIELIISNTGKGTADWGSVKYRPGENMKLYADIGKAKKILKWQAKTSLKEGLMKTVNYYKSLQGY